VVKESIVETSETDTQGACILRKFGSGWIEDSVKVGCCNATLDYAQVVVDGASDLLV
jgi:hypothetical protein